MTIAEFETNLGTFEIELYTDTMPITTQNFIDLANKGFYDDTKFHRVISGFMIQGGDPLSKDDSQQSRWGTGDPGYKITDEHVAGSSNLRGTISMANSGPNSGGSQFFINVVDNTYLDWDKPPAQSKHPAFGKVINGMDVVDTISRAPTLSRDVPKDPIIVKKVSIK